MNVNSLCEGCNGSGVRAPATPSCVLDLPSPAWVVVERCDTCMRYEDDLEAAQAYFAQTRTVLCASQGEHVLALPTSTELRALESFGIRDGQT